MIWISCEYLLSIVFFIFKYQNVATKGNFKDKIALI